MQNWKSCVLVLLLAMAPVVELRGAIPAGVAMGMDLKTVFALSVIGNLLPVPLIILFIRKVFAWMKRHGGKLAAIVSKMEAKAARGAQLFYKYELLGLYIDRLACRSHAQSSDALGRAGDHRRRCNRGADYVWPYIRRQRTCISFLKHQT